MSIPPNRFWQDHSWTRFVLLDSSVGPVTTKRNPLINVVPCTKTSTNDVFCCIVGRVDEMVGFRLISTGRSIYAASRTTDLKKLG